MRFADFLNGLTALKFVVSFFSDSHDVCMCVCVCVCVCVRACVHVHIFPCSFGEHRRSCTLQAESQEFYDAWMDAIRVSRE